MRITIDSDYRLFLIQKVNGIKEQVPCGLVDIPKILKKFDSGDEFKIFEIYNAKIKLINDKKLNILFESADIDFRF